ncbi:hypothetical protein HMPREF9104_01971, partial [Lentilactobacillus kisonensis F0435]
MGILLIDSERIQAVRKRNISLLERKSLGLGFSFKVLMCSFLPGGAVLKYSERNKAVRNWNISLLGWKFPVLEFLPKVLIWKFLLC